MSFTATFYTINKKVNSLKLPTGGTSFSVELKEPTSITAPSLKLRTSNPAAFNYCYISEFNRYYWVSDWESDHGFWICSCTVDVLTTYRTEILNSYQYVVRNQAKYSLEVPDNMYPMIDGVEYSTVDMGDNSPFCTVNGQGQAIPNFVAIYGVAGKGGAPFNGLSYYQSSYAALLEFMNIMFDPNLGAYRSQGESFDISDATMKALIQPLQYIPVCYALPYDLTTKGAIATAVTEVPLGFWTLAGIQGNAKRASEQMGTQFFKIWERTVTLPARNIDTQPLGMWASKLPYTEYKLFAGPFGQIIIDTARMNLSLGNTVKLKIMADLYGNCILTIEDNSGNIIYRTSTNVAVDFKLTSLAINRMDQNLGIAGGVMGAIGSIAGGMMQGATNPGAVISGIAGGVNAAMSTISNAIKAEFPQPQSTGSVSGNLAQVIEPWKLQATFHKIASEDREHFGRPLCERVQLSDGELSGYTVCSNATIEISGTQTEHDAIIAYLNGGFYKEN